MDNSIAKKIEGFFTKYKQQNYKKGEILIRADDDPSGVFFLKEGSVKEYAISKKGDEFVINVFKPISFFPMSWVINNSKNNYFFEAVTDLIIWRAPREEVVKFIKDNPDVLFDLVSRVYKGIDGVLTRMVFLMSGNAYARLITELLIYAERFGNGKNHIEILISEKDLAAQSGMTRETVSREVKILKHKGLVILESNKLCIKDVRSLKAELSERV